VGQLDSNIAASGRASECFNTIGGEPTFAEAKVTRQVADFAAVRRYGAK
jgi:hypothetical protein